MTRPGNGRDDMDTPVELPAHPENVPAIRALGMLTLQLSALNGNLAGMVHELRVAREPALTTGLSAKLRAAFATLRGIATAGEDSFKP